jgi:hypothetical protein
VRIDLEHRAPAHPAEGRVQGDSYRDPGVGRRVRRRRPRNPIALVAAESDLGASSIAELLPCMAIVAVGTCARSIGRVDRDDLCPGRPVDDLGDVERIEHSART